MENRGVLLMAIWMLVAASSFLLGKGLLAVMYDRKKGSGSPGQPEAFPAGICMLIGLTETVHLAAVFLGWGLKEALPFWAALVLILCAAALFYLLARRRAFHKGVGKPEKRTFTAVQQILLACFVLSALLQVIFIWTRMSEGRTGDIVLETVRSFLVFDRIYQADPLTGLPYTEGMPARLKILCLPTLYAFLCELTGTDPSIAVWGLIPVMVLSASYCAYYLLGRQLFSGDRTRLCLFLLIVNLIFWFGDSMEEMDAFQMMHVGYRGTAVRAGILIPYTIWACLQRKWGQAFLCILAEACIVWTFYGMGACLLITVCMALIYLCRPFGKRWEERSWRNS